MLTVFSRARVADFMRVAELDRSRLHACQHGFHIEVFVVSLSTGCVACVAFTGH